MRWAETKKGASTGMGMICALHEFTRAEARTRAWSSLMVLARCGVCLFSGLRLWSRRERRLTRSMVASSVVRAGAHALKRDAPKEKQRSEQR